MVEIVGAAIQALNENDGSITIIGGLALVAIRYAWGKWTKVYDGWPGEKQLLVQFGLGGLGVVAVILWFSFLLAWPHIKGLFIASGV